MTCYVEAVKAKNGDAIIFNYGSGVALIDGGPAGIWSRTLKPRLKEAVGPRALLNWLIVTHVDDDHIKGVLDMLDDPLLPNGKELEIRDMWFNSFDDVAGNGLASLKAIGERLIRELTVPKERPQLLLESIQQGRDLRSKAGARGIRFNQSKCIQLGEPKKKIADGIHFTVLGPSAQQLADFSKRWDKYLETGEQKSEGAKKQRIGNSDLSPTNLSSIVFLAEVGEKKILFTGDARSDHVLEGLKNQNLLDGSGKIRVDLIKVPHHGSYGNSSAEFYEKVTADHYLISTNGLKHKHPDLETLHWIVKSRDLDDEFTIWFTYDPEELMPFGERSEIKDFIDMMKVSWPKATLVAPSAGEVSIKINL